MQIYKQNTPNKYSEKFDRPLASIIHYTFGKSSSERSGGSVAGFGMKRAQVGAFAVIDREEDAVTVMHEVTERSGHAGLNGTKYLRILHGNTATKKFKDFLILARKKSGSINPNKGALGFEFEVSPDIVGKTFNKSTKKRISTKIMYTENQILRYLKLVAKIEKDNNWKGFYDEMTTRVENGGKLCTHYDVSYGSRLDITLESKAIEKMAREKRDLFFQKRKMSEEQKKDLAFINSEIKAVNLLIKKYIKKYFTFK